MIQPSFSWARLWIICWSVVFWKVSIYLWQISNMIQTRGRILQKYNNLNSIQLKFLIHVSCRTWVFKNWENWLTPSENSLNLPWNLIILYRTRCIHPFQPEDWPSWNQLGMINLVVLINLSQHICSLKDTKFQKNSLSNQNLMRHGTKPPGRRLNLMLTILQSASLCLSIQSMRRTMMSSGKSQLKTMKDLLYLSPRW